MDYPRDEWPSTEVIIRTIIITVLCLIYMIFS